MPKRAFLIGGAVAASAALLLFTLLAGPETASGPAERPSDPGLADLPTDDLPDAPVVDPDAARAIPVGRGDVGEYAFNREGRVTILQWASITPKPEGVSDVVAPQARTFFSPSRVLQMTAREGTVVAPDNEPRKGNLRGDVVLTLYERPDGKPIDFDDEAALAKFVTMKVYLDDAAFDLELGQVDSPGPVHLTGPQVDFRGTGLSLNYNQLRQRLERLEISRGERLRFRPTGKQEDAEEVVAAEVEPAAATMPVADSGTMSTETDASTPAAQAQADLPEPAQTMAAAAEGAQPAVTDVPTPSADASASVMEDQQANVEANAPDAALEPSAEVAAAAPGPVAEPAPASAEAIPAPAAEAPAAPDALATAPPAEAPSENVATPEPAAPAAETAAAALDPDTQFYRARFQEDVRVVTAPEGDDRRVTMTGDELAVIFAMAPSDDEEEPAAAQPEPAPSTDAPSAEPRDDKPEREPRVPAAAATTEAEPAPQPVGRSLMAERDDDIVVTWVGRLIVQPHAEGRDLITGPDDVLVAMSGSEAKPVVVETAPQETITAAHAQYLASATEVKASAFDAAPMRITAPELGVITGQAITLNQTAGTGSVQGPGWLRGNVSRRPRAEDRADAAAALDAAAMPIAPAAAAPADETSVAVVTPAAPDATPADAPDPTLALKRVDTEAPPPPPAAAGSTDAAPSPPTEPAPETEAETLEVAWSDRLDLTFFKKEDAPRDSAPDEAAPLDRLADGGDLGGIRTATFFGDVSAEHPRFRLAGDEVGITLTDPATPDDDATIDAMRGRGNVQLFAQAENPDDQLDLTADELDVDFAQDPEGELYPAEVIAQSKVTVKQPTLELRTERLELVTAPREEAPADAPDAEAASTTARDRLAVRRMVALHGVDVDINESDLQLQLTGDRLSVAEDGDRIELFGADGTPAQVQQPDGTLYGDHIVVGQKDQTVVVLGPGYIEMNASPEQKDTRLRVDWREAMRFDNAAGVAEFTGGVEAKTSSPTDRTTLRTDTLALEFEPDTAAPADANPAADDAVATEAVAATEPATGEAADAAQKKKDERHHRIRVATARGNAVFASESFDPAPPRATTTSVFQLRGPVIAFTNVPGREGVEVPGPGQMLISDTRPPQVRREIADGRATEMADVSGRGDTGFTWTQSLVMDGAANRMTMRGDVKVTHRAAKTAEEPNPQPIFFNAQRVVADLENSAGVSSWMDREGAKPQLTHIEAHDRIEIRDRGRGAEIMADDLAYDEKTGDLTLSARPGSLVRVSDPRHPVPVSGRVIIYNPRTGKVDIRELGSATVPIERNRDRKRRP